MIVKNLWQMFKLSQTEIKGEPGEKAFATLASLQLNHFLF
jgi:hypothetical protein